MILLVSLLTNCDCLMNLKVLQSNMPSINKLSSQMAEK